jgi:hypothetical protein
VTQQKVSIDHRPSSNRRRHGYTAPPCGNCGGSLLVSCPRKRVGDRFRPVRNDESRERDPPAPRHSSLPALGGSHPSARRDATLKPVDLQGQPMDVRGEWARLWGEPTQRQEQPTGLRTAATGPRSQETESARGASAGRSPSWIAARYVHRQKNSATKSPYPPWCERRQRRQNIPKLARRWQQSHARHRAAKWR